MSPTLRVWESRTCEHLLNNIDAAMQQLHRSKMTDAAVHDARKALKKARAALRLLQGGIARTTYRTENILLRDAGRYLSAVREAKSLLGALNSLRDQHPDQMPHSGVAPLQKAFRTGLTDARRQLARGRHLARCIRLLEDARSRAARIKFAAGSKSVQSGLHRVYRKGRKALAEAKNNPTPDALHEWRKQVKYLFNMVDDSLSLSNGDAKRIKKRADRLADRLGEDHDLSVLARQLARNEDSSETIQILQPLIRKRRKKLQKHAFRLGKKVYDSKPSSKTALLLKHSAVL